MKASPIACVLVLAAGLLSGCFAETSGSPVPPPDFGDVVRPLFGCPDVQGVYAWPPVAGEYASGFATNRIPWAGGRPVAVERREMQLWIDRDADERVTVRSRRVNRAANVRDSMAHEWSYAEYEDSDYACRGGALVVAPIEMAIDDDYGGEGVRRGFHLVSLDDGALAVGIETVAYGRTGSLFSWGGQGYGSYRMADKTYWTWSKLARTGDGAIEPAPIDAGRPAAAR